MVVILPPVRRSALRTFWLAVTFLAGAIAGVLVACVRDLEQALAAGLVATVLAAAPGMVWPGAAGPAYRAWNHLARVYARIARLTLLGVAYYGIVVPVGRVGATLDLVDSRGSMWHPATPAATDGSQSELGEAAGGWIGRLARWGSRSRHSWWLVLLPVLVLLRAVESEQPAGPTADLYTLF